MYHVKLIDEWQCDEQFGTNILMEFVYDGPEENVRKLCKQYGVESFFDKNETEHYVSIEYGVYEPLEVRNTFPKELNRKNRPGWVKTSTVFYYNEDKDMKKPMYQLEGV